MLELTFNHWARNIAKNDGIEVVFTANHSNRVDDRKIYLRPLPHNLKDTELDIAQANAFQKLAHVLFTDFRLVNEFKKNEQIVTNQILQAINDARVEFSISGKYQGARSLIKTAIDELSSNPEWIAEKLTSNLKTFSLYLYIKCLEQVEWVSALTIIPTLQEKVESLIGSDGYFQINELLEKEFVRLNNTQDAIELTQSIIECLDSIPMTPMQVSQDCSDDKSVEDPSENPVLDAEEETSVFEELSSENATGGEVLDTSKWLDDFMEDALKGGKPDYQESALNMGGIEELVGSVKQPKENLLGYQYAMNNLGPTIMRMRSELTEVIYSISDSKQRYGNSGRFKASKAYRHFLLNESDIFLQEETGVDVDASVQLLVDLSGSMKGHPSQCALRCAGALEESLSNETIEVEVLGFGDRYQNPITVFKSFDEDSTKGQARMGEMELFVGGGTPLARGLFEASLRLVERSNRKILFVLTDGLPDSIEPCLEQMKLMTEDDVEIIYLIIGFPTEYQSRIEKMGITCINITRAEQLGEMALNHLIEYFEMYAAA